MPEIGVYTAPFQVAIYKEIDYVKEVLERDQKLPAAECERVNSDRDLPLTKRHLGQSSAREMMTALFSLLKGSLERSH